MSIKVTDKAANELKKLLSSENLPVETSGLRVSVKGGGCSGYSYSMSLAERPMETDKVFDEGGIRVFVDPKSYMFIVGTELDYQDGLTGRGFVFTNPNATKTCGCGSSFSV